MTSPKISVAAPTVEIAGSDDRFPVRRIFCVGRNYAEHAREMGGAPEREPPFFFAKPADAIVGAKEVIAQQLVQEILLRCAPPEQKGLVQPLEKREALVHVQTLAGMVRLRPPLT